MPKGRALNICGFIVGSSESDCDGFCVVKFAFMPIFLLLSNNLE